jgi:hypothetical protein
VPRAFSAVTYKIVPPYDTGNSWDEVFFLYAPLAERGCGGMRVPIAAAALPALP